MPNNPQKPTKREMDVEKYLKRINYNGGLETTLETLQELCRCHVTSVPITNLGFFGDSRVVLDVGVMYDTIVNRGQGDFCFSNNYLFSRLLKELGFNVKFCKGSVVEVFTHAFTVVTIDEQEWLCDVGFLIIQPIQIKYMEPQVHCNRTYRIRPTNDVTHPYLLERLHKTVMNEKGDICRQGPILPDDWKENDLETISFLSDESWRDVFKFNTKDEPLSSFIDATNDYQTNPESPLQEHIIFNVFLDGGKRILNVYNGHFVLKEHITPQLDKILMSRDDITTNEDAKATIEKYSGMKIDFVFNFYDK